jgi:hypothetical protein
MEGKRNKRRGMGGDASTGVPHASSTGSGLGVNGSHHSRHASGPPVETSGSRANGGGSVGFKLLRRPASGVSATNGSFAALANASDTEGNGQPDGDSATEPEDAGGDTSAGEGESTVSTTTTGSAAVRPPRNGSTGRVAQLIAEDGRGAGAISPLLGPLEEEEEEAAPAVPQVRGDVGGWLGGGWIGASKLQHRVMPAASTHVAATYESHMYAWGNRRLAQPSSAQGSAKRLLKTGLVTLLQS